MNAKGLKAARSPNKEKPAVTVLHVRKFSGIFVGTGMLITWPPAAGSADSPGSSNAPMGQYFHDVQPFELADR